MKTLRIALGVTLLLVMAGGLRADRVVLVNGRVLSGEILSEDGSEVVLLVDKGMRMRLDRTRIREIERTPKATPDPEPPVEPAPPPEPQPPAEPLPPSERVPEPVDTVPPPEAGSDDPLPPGRLMPRVGLAGSLIEVAPAVAWRHAASRLPVLRGARTIGFPAYEIAGHEPLSRTGQDPVLETAVRACGHGGELARWEFRYVGMRDLRFDDEVKFLAEITAVGGFDPPLIRLLRGPLPHTTRMQLILLRRERSVQLLATPFVFTVKDFRRESLDDLARRPQPVRTYRADLVPVASAWLTEEESRILEDASSPFGETLAVRLDRYRFRIAWFETAPDRRPALDPALLRSNHARPLAAPGIRAAGMDEIRRLWGDPVETKSRLAALCRNALWKFARIGVKPGGSYHVERDILSEHGPLGITLRTLRYRIGADLLEVLANPLGEKR